MWRLLIYWVRSFRSRNLISFSLLSPWLLFLPLMSCALKNWILNYVWLLIIIVMSLEYGVLEDKMSLLMLYNHVHIISLFLFLGIYGATSYHVRMSLWIGLSNLRGQCCLFWNFNAILSAGESKGGFLPNSVSCADFNDWINNNELIALLLLFISICGLMAFWKIKELTGN